MRRFATFVLACLTPLALAAQWGVERTDKFENLVGDNVNIDGGVTYNGFMLVGDDTTPQTSGIRPSSGNHSILTEHPANGLLLTTGRCMVFKSFFVGCTHFRMADEPSKPLACNITFWSYDKQGNQNGIQHFIVSPPALSYGEALADSTEVVLELPPAEMVEMEASVRVDGLDLGTVASALWVDDVSYVQFGEDRQGVEECGSGF